MKYPVPKNVQELRRFLGIMNFYRENIPYAAHYQEKFYKYLKSAKKKDMTEIRLPEDEKQAFEDCKNSIKEAVKISHPSSSAPLVLMCDASDTCLGASLQRKTGNTWKPLGFFS